MKVYGWLASFLAVSATLFLHTDGSMFDFHLIEESDNHTNQVRRCQELGYDGLAVLSTPEANRYAVKISDYILNVRRQYIFIGTHYNAELQLIEWDDGSNIRGDSNFGHDLTNGSSTFSVGVLVSSVQTRMYWSYHKLPALCGNHKNFRGESMGTTVQGQLQTTSKTILSVEKVRTYLQCTLLCGIESHCRAAEFDSDLSTCTVIGKYTDVGLLNKPQIVTYVRQKNF